MSRRRASPVSTRGDSEARTSERLRRVGCGRPPNGKVRPCAVAG
jgi:hypothetical protein